MNRVNLSLSPHFQQILDSNPAWQAEFRNIASQGESEEKYQDLLKFGRQLQAQGKAEAAIEVYQALQQGGEVPALLRVGADQEIASLLGKGTFGGRAELLVKQVLEESVKPQAILPMAAASLVGHFTKLASLGRLVSAPANLFTRGTAAKSLATAISFGAEGIAFAAMGRALREKAEGNWGEDIARSYIGLGALKFSGWIGQRAVKWADLRRGKFQALQSAVIPQMTLFAGLSLAHKLEGQFGLRPESLGDHWLADTFAAMVSLQVGAKLGRSLVGESWHHWEHAIESASLENENVAVGILGPKWETPEGLGLDAPIWMASDPNGRASGAKGSKNVGGMKVQAAAPKGRPYRLLIPNSLGLFPSKILETFVSDTPFDTSSSAALIPMREMHRALEEILFFGEERGVRLEGELAQQLRKWAKENSQIVRGILAGSHRMEVQFALATRSIQLLKILEGDKTSLELRPPEVTEKSLGLARPLFEASPDATPAKLSDIPSTLSAAEGRQDSLLGPEEFLGEHRLAVESIASLIALGNRSMTRAEILRGLPGVGLKPSLGLLTKLLDAMVVGKRLSVRDQNGWKFYSVQNSDQTPLPPPVETLVPDSGNGPQTGAEFLAQLTPAESAPPVDTLPMGEESPQTDRLGEDSTLKSAQVEPVSALALVTEVEDNTPVAGTEVTAQRPQLVLDPAGPEARGLLGIGQAFRFFTRAAGNHSFNATLILPNLERLEFNLEPDGKGAFQVGRNQSGQWTQPGSRVQLIVGVERVAGFAHRFRVNFGPEKPALEFNLEPALDRHGQVTRLDLSGNQPSSARGVKDLFEEASLQQGSPEVLAVQVLSNSTLKRADSKFGANVQKLGIALSNGDGIELQVQYGTRGSESGRFNFRILDAKLFRHGFPVDDAVTLLVQDGEGRTGQPFSLKLPDPYGGEILFATNGGEKFESGLFSDYSAQVLRWPPPVRLSLKGHDSEATEPLPEGTQPLGLTPTRPENLEGLAAQEKLARQQMLEQIRQMTMQALTGEILQVSKLREMAMGEPAAFEALLEVFEYATLGSFDPVDFGGIQSHDFQVQVLVEMLHLAEAGHPMAATKLKEMSFNFRSQDSSEGELLARLEKVRQAP